MHSEFYQLSEEAAATLRSVKENGGRVIAVGTTSIRTLETIGSKFNGQIQADSGWTNIFIKPGYDWKVVDAFLLISTYLSLPWSCSFLPLQAVNWSSKPISMLSMKNTVSLALVMPCLSINFYNQKTHIIRQ